MSKFIFLVVLLASSCSFALTPTPINTPTPALSFLPSSPFVAVSDQGRPLIGASINVTDQFGNPIIACVGPNFPCTQLISVPPSGIVQFWAAAGTYNVVVSGAGISRNYVTYLPMSGGGGGGGITSINSLTDPAITINNDGMGTGFSISTPDSSHVTLHLPNASGSADGLITHLAQLIGGAKNWLDRQTFTQGILVNGFQADAFPLKVETNGNPCMLFVDGTNDEVDVGTCDATALQGNFNSISGDYHTAVVGENTDIGSGVIGSVSGAGYGTEGIAESGSTGTAISGLSASTNAKAGAFARSMNSSTVPVVEISRNAATDGQPLLLLNDLSTSSSATYVIQYVRNSVSKWGITPAGSFLAAADNTINEFSFISDLTTGIKYVSSGAFSLTSGGVNKVDINAAGITMIGVAAISTASGSAASLNILNGGTGPSISANSGNFVVDVNGEVTFAGVNGDGTGKVLCVKSDGNIGTCTDAVGGGGTCTCA